MNPTLITLDPALTDQVPTAGVPGWTAVAALGMAAVCWWLAANRRDIVPLLGLLLAAGFITALIEVNTHV